MINKLVNLSAKKHFNNYFFKTGIRENLLFDSYCSQVEQINLACTYRKMQQAGATVSFKDVGFRVFSQNDEDGILLYIFSLIGTTNKFCVDLAFESPFGSNTANLLCNLGWDGLLICGNENDKTESESFFLKNANTKICPPKVIHKWVTAENINNLLQEHSVPKEIDLFSLDIDGVDYWIWHSLEVVMPRVVVVEYHNIWGSEKAVTVPYTPTFDRHKVHPDYMGASLRAFAKLARTKGYKLVAVNKLCFNAFFVKDEKNLLPEIAVEDCFFHRQAQEGIKNRLPAVCNLNWVEV